MKRAESHVFAAFGAQRNMLADQPKEIGGFTHTLNVGMTRQSIHQTRLLILRSSRDHTHATTFFHPWARAPAVASERVPTGTCPLRSTCAVHADAAARGACG